MKKRNAILISIIYESSFDGIVDVNECITMQPCRNGGTCQNIDGSYLCQCKEGWTDPDCTTGKWGVLGDCGGSILDFLLFSFKIHNYHDRILYILFKSAKTVKMALIVFAALL